MTHVYVVVGILALYGLHRLAQWAEDRGWIYYVKKRGHSGSVGSAFLEIQAIMEPSKRYVIEERVKETVEEQDSGAPPGIADRPPVGKES